MQVCIRPEKANDYQAIAAVIAQAFGQKTEAELVKQLRKKAAFIPDLSLVAVSAGRIVGHILLYPVELVGEESLRRSLSLAPLSVHPEFQRKSIGGQLIAAGLMKAKELGFESVTVVGYSAYYARFGFQRASGWGLSLPFDAPDEAFMALELIEDRLKDIRGVVRFPPEYLDGL
jgi:putative acetyltransferase